MPLLIFPDIIAAKRFLANSGVCRYPVPVRLFFVQPEGQQQMEALVRVGKVDPRITKYWQRIEELKNRSSTQT